MHWAKTQNYESGSHQTRASEKHTAIGQFSPSGHQGVHLSGNLGQRSCPEKLGWTHKNPQRRLVRSLSTMGKWRTIKT